MNRFIAVIPLIIEQISGWGCKRTLKGNTERRAGNHHILKTHKKPFLSCVQQKLLRNYYTPIGTPRNTCFQEIGAWRNGARVTPCRESCTSQIRSTRSENLIHLPQAVEFPLALELITHSLRHMIPFVRKLNTSLQRLTYFTLQRWAISWWTLMILITSPPKLSCRRQG